MSELRDIRARNYRVKRSANFECSNRDCSEKEGLLVVRIGEGEADSDFCVRCAKHVGNLQIQPGQWNEWTN